MIKIQPAPCRAKNPMTEDAGISKQPLPRHARLFSGLVLAFVLTGFGILIPWENIKPFRGLHHFSWVIAFTLSGKHLKSLLFAAAVFFYQPYRYGINFLHHSQVLATPLILRGFYFVLKKRNAPGFFFFTLALARKEAGRMPLAGFLALCLAPSKIRKSGIPPGIKKFPRWEDPH